MARQGGIKPESRRRRDFQREQHLEFIRTGGQAKRPEKVFHEKLERKLETGKVWICGQCHTLQEAMRCRNCGTWRFTITEPGKVPYAITRLP